MKRFADYTDAELIALTSQQRADLVDLECAVEGIPLLPVLPPVPDRSQIPSEDMTVYELPQLTFLHVDEADRVLEAILGAELVKTTYPRGKYLYGSKVDVKAQARPPELAVRRVLSAEAAAIAEKMAADIEEAQTLYKDSKKEYDNTLEQRAPMKKKVDEAIRAALQKAYKRLSITEKFTRYLRIADGDHAIAFKFLQDVVSTFTIDEHDGLKDELLSLPSAYSVDTSDRS